MRTIFLINPISGRGHLDAYARLYARALVELGYRVVLVAAADGGTEAYHRRVAHGGQEGTFSFVSFAAAQERLAADEAKGQNARLAAMARTNSVTRSELDPLSRARLVWREEGTRGIGARFLRMPRRIARSILPLPLRIKIVALRRRAVRQLLRLAIGRELYSRLYEDGRVSLHHLACVLRGAVSIEGGREPDLAFFLYLDMMTERAAAVGIFDSMMPCPWAGILFHPRLLTADKARTEGYFASQHARGAIFLVPAALEPYRQAARSLYFAVAPDVADLALAETPPIIGAELRSRAGNRKVILQIGSIAPHKGIVGLLDMIAMADPTRFFFALIGEVHWESFGSNKSKVEAFYRNPPENVFIHEHYIDDEREYNSAISSCDIIYAVYQGFNSSSNSLTKAAGLRRPILVTQGTLMGERVLAANIGSVAPEGDASAILVALSAISEKEPGSFGFDCYLAAHSLEALKAVLAQAVPSWLRASPH